VVDHLVKYFKIKDDNKEKITENNNFTHEYKGWMPPSGDPIIFGTHHEHHEKIPVALQDEIELEERRDKVYSRLNSMMKRGYTRFVSDGMNYYIHYDKRVPSGIKSALRALKYMKPSNGERITITNLPWDKNQAVVGDSEVDIDSVAEAAQFIRSENKLTESNLMEHVLSIGFNPEQEPLREKYRQQLIDILHNSYKEIGGYGGFTSGSPEEYADINNDISTLNMKAMRRKCKITAVILYKDRYGRKAVGIGTDGTRQGKVDYGRMTREDHAQQRSWAEVSGAPEIIQKKMGSPVVPNTHAAKLTGKNVELDPNGTHYSRKIGTDSHQKVIMGHPKID
jgi:hypothetical protein